jgi:hypothetical protein
MSRQFLGRYIYIIRQVENSHFDIECVAQYAQNIRERLG